jgi:hypothetical protein
MQKNPRRDVGPLAGTANYVDLTITGEFAEPCTQLSDWNVDRVRYVFDREFKRFAYVSK